MEMQEFLRKSLIHNDDVNRMKPEEQSEISVLVMEYQNIHQRVEHHTEAGTQNTLQALVVVASLLAFSISRYYDDSFEVFVNVAMFLVLPIVAFSLVCSVLSISIKISAYGEYLITVEKRINYILQYSNDPEAEANEKIVDWERWRNNHGIAQDRLVFYDGAILYAVIVLGSSILCVVRLLYLSSILSNQLRLWAVTVPGQFALFIIVIMALLSRLNAHIASNEKLLNTAEITYGKSAERKKSMFSPKSVKLIALFAILYFGLEVILLMSIRFPFYNSENKAYFLENQIIAHRGLHDDSIPENTLAAFNNAVSRNYIVELDIRFSKDGIPVVIHDKELSRLCQIDKKVSDLTIDDIKRLTVKETETIPTLEEALQLIDGRVPVIVDIKDYFLSRENKQAVADLLSNYSGLSAVQSFGPLFLSWMKRNYPSIPRGQIFGNWGIFSSRPIFCLRDNVFNFISKPDFINYDREVVRYASLQQARFHGVPVIGWMFNLDELKNLSGYDSVYNGFII